MLFIKILLYVFMDYYKYKIKVESYYDDFHRNNYYELYRNRVNKTKLEIKV